MPPYILVDYLKGLIYKIERQNEELTHFVTKKDFLHIINAAEENVEDFVSQKGH